MQKLTDVVSLLDTYLDIKNFPDDNAYNGLQVEGVSEVNSIVFTADAGIETFRMAVALHADMIVVHHGIFWKGIDPSVKGRTKERVTTLLDHGISLYAVHLPLDKHPDIGNNAQLLKILGFRKDKPFGWYKGEQISFTGVVDMPKTIDQIVEDIQDSLAPHCVVLPFGKREIKTIAVMSGGAGYSSLNQALDAGVDLYLSGEPIECYHEVKDAGFNVIFAGHHATEIVGVRALAEVVKDKLAIQTQFIDLPTGF